MAIRQDIRRHNVARLMILGWSTGRIARKLGCTVRTVRDTVATPEFGEIFPELQAEHYKHVDRMMGSLLLAALSTLLKMLKHEDWRARYAAIQTIMQMHGKIIERLAIDGHVLYSGQVQHGHAVMPEDAMSPEVREKAREVLRLMRPMRALPSPMLEAGANGHREDEA